MLAAQCSAIRRMDFHILMASVQERIVSYGNAKEHGRSNLVKNLDRYKGCLIGGAVGDALGYPVEFMSAASIFSRYGQRGITDYELSDGLALIS